MPLLTVSVHIVLYYIVVILSGPFITCVVKKTSGVYWTCNFKRYWKYPSANKVKIKGEIICFHNQSHSQNGWVTRLKIWLASCLQHQRQQSTELVPTDAKKEGTCSLPDTLTSLPLLLLLRIQKVKMYTNNLAPSMLSRPTKT